MVWVKQLERLQAGAKRYTRRFSAPLELQLPKPAYITDGQPPPTGEILDGLRTLGSPPESDMEITPVDGRLATPSRAHIGSTESSNYSTLSLASVVGERKTTAFSG